MPRKESGNGKVLRVRKWQFLSIFFMLSKKFLREKKADKKIENEFYFLKSIPTVKNISYLSDDLNRFLCLAVCMLNCKFINQSIRELMKLIIYISMVLF